MAENDIYNSQGRYEAFKENLDKLLIPSKKHGNKAKYYCRNKANLKYFEKLFARFEAIDISFIRRMRLLRTLLIAVHATDSDLCKLDRDDVDKVVAYMHSRYDSPKSKSDFIKDIKYIWKIILPEKDSKGRIDDTVAPYPVRHLSPKMERAKQKMRNDKLDYSDFEKIMDYFSSDSMMHFYLSLAVESIARPQEILYRKIRDVEMHDNYAKIYLSDHGKEGTGLIQCIDSYPLLLQWIEKHPKKNDDDSYIFINLGRKNFGRQLTPININKKLKTACKNLGLKKNITCYSLKRNGVTFRRLRGDTDMEIQHAARWTSTKQLQTYDMSTQDEAFKIRLIKRGLISADKPQYQKYEPKNKDCGFCETKNPFNAKTCSSCKRPLHRKGLIEDDKQKDKEIDTLKTEVQALKESIEKRQPYEDMMYKFLQNKEVQDMFKKSIS